MRKSNMFKKFLVGAIMAATLATTATAMASPNIEVYDFNIGSKIVHLEGEHNEVFLAGRKVIWEGLAEGRAISYLMERDLEKNITNMSIIVAPKGEPDVYIDGTEIARGKLHGVQKIEAQKLAKNWKLDFHEERGTAWEPYAEGCLSKKIG